VVVYIIIIIIYLFMKHMHIDGRKQGNEVHTVRYCWPTQSMQFLSNMCNNINYVYFTDLLKMTCTVLCNFRLTAKENEIGFYVVLLLG